ncbi:hypothetical protein [Mycobacterium sp. 1165178.9]|uniref:hypothetical protein n=1 Tax=Mycobacterium sp. 1165178.9 TaxID=1834070 RepID=UPI0007FE3750|nr:hypothetical protein [Mycobacterium sp. 1165178.9]OBK80347.1 hypothetical protein A5652_18110 [Mycobacterium sp. 1165178.9]
MQAQINALKSWAQTPDRSARTHKARHAAENRYEKLVDPDGKLPAAARAKMAEAARKAHFRGMALKSVESRRRRAMGGAA